MFGFHESMVTTTIASGKVLMRDRKLLTMDEAAISRPGAPACSGSLGALCRAMSLATESRRYA